MTVRIIKLWNTEKEAHFPEGNQLAAVCFTLNRERRTAYDLEGNAYPVYAWVIDKSTAPYIDFISICEDEEDGTGEEDDKFPFRGLELKEAENVLTELTRAIEYLKELQKENKWVEVISSPHL